MWLWLIYMDLILTDPETVCWTLSTIAQALAAVLALAAMFTLFRLEREEHLLEREFFPERQRFADALDIPSRYEYAATMHGWPRLLHEIAVKIGECDEKIEEHRTKQNEASESGNHINVKDERRRVARFRLRRARLGAIRSRYSLSKNATAQIRASLRLPLRMGVLVIVASVFFLLFRDEILVCRTLALSLAAICFLASITFWLILRILLPLTRS